MKLKKLEKSPLVDAVVELRFESKIPNEAFVGFIYTKFSQLFPEIERLPIADLPSSVRSGEPSLKFQPTHKLTNEQYYLNVGPNVIGLGYDSTRSEEYAGWKNFSKDLNGILTTLSGHIETVDRLGVRFINFSDKLKLVDGLNINISSPWSEDNSISQKTIVFVLNNEAFNTKISVVEDAQLMSGNKTRKGQILDIDTYTEDHIALEDVADLATKAHDIIEDIFIAAVSEELMEKFKK